MVYFIENQKVELLVANWHDNKEYVINKRNLNQTLHHGLLIQEVQRAIKLNQEACIKPYINMNTQLRKNAKTDFKKYLSS